MKFITLFVMNLATHKVAVEHEHVLKNKHWRSEVRLLNV